MLAFHCLNCERSEAKISVQGYDIFVTCENCNEETIYENGETI